MDGFNTARQTVAEQEAILSNDDATTSELCGAAGSLYDAVKADLSYPREAEMAAWDKELSGLEGNLAILDEEFTRYKKEFEDVPKLLETKGTKGFRYFADFAAFLVEADSLVARYRKHFDKVRTDYDSLQNRKADLERVHRRIAGLSEQKREWEPFQRVVEIDRRYEASSAEITVTAMAHPNVKATLSGAPVTSSDGLVSKSVNKW